MQRQVEIEDLGARNREDMVCRGCAFLRKGCSSLSRFSQGPAILDLKQTGEYWWRREDRLRTNCGLLVTRRRSVNKKNRNL